MSTAKRLLPREEEEAPASRIERKERTRQRLIDAALGLIGQGRSFTSLGLREITREAGVVPGAFYRHFRDLDELGLALVEMGGVTLRRLLREARRDGIPPTDMLRGSVRIYKRFVEERSLVFRFIAARRRKQQPQVAAAGHAPFQREAYNQQAAQPSIFGGSAAPVAAAPAINAPAWFNEQSFLNAARSHFGRGLTLDAVVQGGVAGAVKGDELQVSGVRGHPQTANPVAQQRGNA